MSKMYNKPYWNPMLQLHPGPLNYVKTVKMTSTMNPVYIFLQIQKILLSILIYN